ncbi:MAG: hypothetical protein ABFR89_00550 [Actinomycetota bacterium]
MNWFSDADDARRYLFEIARLWVVWVVGLVLLFAVDGWMVLLAGIVVIAVLVWLVQPIQRRAADIDDPGEFVEGSGGRFGGKRTRKEMAMRVLLYGKAPLVEAIEEFDAWFGWVWIRQIVIATTAVVFAIVFLDVFSAPQS